MNTTMIIIAFVATIFIAVMVLIIGLSNYQAYHRQKMSLAQTFPFETNDRPRMPFNGFVRLVVALFCISFILLQFSLLTRVKLTSYVLCLVTGSLASVSLLSLFLIDIRHVKLHTLASSLAFTFTILEFGFLAYLAFTTPIAILVPPLLGGLAILSALVEMILLFSPRLKKWMILDKKILEDGTIVYQRPKVVYLALMEWITMGMNILYAILLFIFLFPYA